MDVADQAASYADHHLQVSMANHYSGRQTAAAVSNTHCDECGERIPEGRREAVPGCRLCVRCQADQEL